MSNITISSIHHYALSVKDIQATTEWYGLHFNFSVERQFGFPELSIYIAHLIHPTGIRIELLSTVQPNLSADEGLDAFGAIKNLGSKHIGLLVQDLREVEQYVLAQPDIRVLHAYTEVPPAGVKNLWILDNEGNHIELVEWL